MSVWNIGNFSLTLMQLIRNFKAEFDKVVALVFFSLASRFLHTVTGTLHSSAFAPLHSVHGKNVTVYDQKVKAIIDKTHVRATHVLQMHRIWCSQFIALIVDSHVHVVILAAYWKYFFLSSHPPPPPKIYVSSLLWKELINQLPASTESRKRTMARGMGKV